MTAQVFIVLAQAKNVLVVPTAAVGNAGEGATVAVQVLKPDGSVEKRRITIGIKSEISAEITNGLNEKEQVVIRQIAAQGSSKSPLSVGKGR
jgi:macrolide-specific efflux system membrane fusion protein